MRNFIYFIILANTGKKFALIIGNDKYEHAENKLKNSVQTAKELERLLKTINFTVVMASDIPNEAEIMRKVQEFERTMTDDALVLFCFSGHGYYFNGNNYLIPTDDTRINQADDILDLGSDVNRIAQRLLHDKPLRTAIVILDCCRPYVLGNPTALRRE